MTNTERRVRDENADLDDDLIDEAVTTTMDAQDEIDGYEWSMTLDEGDALIGNYIAIVPQWSHRRTTYMRVDGFVTSDYQFNSQVERTGHVLRIMGYKVRKRLHPGGDYFVARDDGSEGAPQSIGRTQKFETVKESK